MTDRLDPALAGRHAPDLAQTLSLWDWRGRIAELYGAVRALEPHAGWTLWRQSRDDMFRTHPQSPTAAWPGRERLALPCFPYDPGLRFAVDLDPVAWGPCIRVDVGDDGALAFAPFGLTRGLADRLGAELTLYWIGGYGGGVFLPFRDATSGRETFGGGRYLLDTIKSADLGRDGAGRVVLDFNFAYNPSCAYSDAWVCPLAPPENVLPAAVRGGELAPAATPRA